MLAYRDELSEEERALFDDLVGLEAKRKQRQRDRQRHGTGGQDGQTDVGLSAKQVISAVRTLSREAFGAAISRGSTTTSSSKYKEIVIGFAEMHELTAEFSPMFASKWLSATST